MPEAWVQVILSIPCRPGLSNIPKMFYLFDSVFEETAILRDIINHSFLKDKRKTAK
jgi:hypothetical protein